MTFTIRPRGLLIAASIAVLAIGAGVAYASIPDGSGVIHGCYNGDNGNLRVIDPSSSKKDFSACRNNETALNWSQTGPQGPQGPTGATGPQGPSGVTTAWSEYAYPSRPADFYPAVGAEIAHFTFTSPAAGFVVVTANFATRIHNGTATDCRVQTQIAPAAGAPDETAPGFVDQWMNHNLPTQEDAGTYLGLNASGTRVLPVVIGSNTVYLNGKTDCTAAVLGPVTLTALLVQNNPPALLVAPPP